MRETLKKHQNKVDIPCHVRDCDANEDGFCRKHSAIIIEETGYCQTGLEQMEKKRMQYDVDILITEDTPDDEDSMLCGPLSGGFCETFAICEKIAKECGGGWADWEPYRCTYEFPDEEKADKFCRRIKDEVADTRFVNYEKRVYTK